MGSEEPLAAGAEAVDGDAAARLRAERDEPALAPGGAAGEDGTAGGSSGDAGGWLPTAAPLEADCEVWSGEEAGLLPLLDDELSGSAGGLSSAAGELADDGPLWWADGPMEGDEDGEAAGAEAVSCAGRAEEEADCRLP